MRDIKKEYSAPECTVVLFSNEDIVTASNAKMSSFDADQYATTGDFNFDWFLGK